MSKRPDNTKPPSARGQSPGHTSVGSSAKVISKKDFDMLAALLGGRDSFHRVQKRDAYGDGFSATGELYENREFVAAYERFKPVYDKVVSDMQRVLARNAEFEANKVAKELRKSLSDAKEHVQRMKTHAQEVIDRVERLLRDLQSKPLVRLHLKKAGSAAVSASEPVVEASPTTLASANETRLDSNRIAPREVVSGDQRYHKAAYAPPAKGALYSVRDKTSGERVIRVIGVSPDGALVQAEILDRGKPSVQPIQLAVESLGRQAAKGWCHLLTPVASSEAAPNTTLQPPWPNTAPNVSLRLDIQNFGRCCADIVRANIKFGTQPIKDVGDGPFRTGNYEQAFLTFEQLALGFNSAVANSRRAIADGRRDLTAEKGNLSGKEIQDLTAAFVRSEQLIHTAEREFAIILEGLRMYLRAQQDAMAIRQE